MQYLESVSDQTFGVALSSLGRLRSDLRAITTEDAAQELGIPMITERVAEGGMMSERQVSPMAQWQAALMEMTSDAYNALEQRELEQAGNKMLESISAIELQLTEMDAHALELYGHTVSEAIDAEAASPAVDNGGGGGGGGGGPTLPSVVAKMFKKLKQLGTWLLSVVQTLLTPKGWSIEGGVSLGLLASAKLKVEFGK